MLRDIPKPPWLCPSVRSKGGPVHLGPKGLGCKAYRSKGVQKCRSRDSPKNGSADADALEKRNRILLERNRYNLKRYNKIPPEEEAGSKVPKGRSRIDLVGAVGAESLPLVDPAHDICRQ